MYENVKAGTAYVVKSSLKVMLDSDYVAAFKNKVEMDNISEQIIRQVVIPELEHEVNCGKGFARREANAQESGLEAGLINESLILINWFLQLLRLPKKTAH